MLRRWYAVRKAGADAERLREARLQCRAQSTLRNYVSDNLDPPFDIDREDAEHLYLPTFIGRGVFGPETQDLRDPGDPAQIHFAGQLDESRFQPQAVEACVAELRATGGAILHKACGLGKTVDALAIIAQLGVRFGVVVDKSFLMDQWRDRIAQFLPGIRIGYARGSHVDRDCTAVIVMAKSLSLYAERGDYDFQGIGLWIFDEAHKFCAQTLSRCLPTVAARYMLALSATPQRRDGLDSILFAWFGRIAYSAQREHETAEVYRIVYDNPGKQKERFLRGGKVNLARMINDVCADEERNAVIAWHLARALHEDRRILLLSDRREHLVMLEKAVVKELAFLRATQRRHHTLTLLGQLGDATIIEAVDANMVKEYEWVIPELAAIEEDFTIDYYVGGRSRRELAQAERANLILATFQMAKEALDLKPPPDALFLASPKRDTVQAIGRLRIELLEKTARIYDVVDAWSLFQWISVKRDALYDEREYEIVDWDKMVMLGRREPEPHVNLDYPDE